MEELKKCFKKILIESYERPPGYPELSEYCAVNFDSNSKEPIAWGFKILRPLGTERFEALRDYGAVECISYSPYDSPRGDWALIVKYLTPEQAVEKYGPITHQKFGPQGGWRSVTYGSTQFVARELKPSSELEHKFSFEKEIVPKAKSVRSTSKNCYSSPC